MSFIKEPARKWYIPYHCRCNALNGAHALSQGLAEYNGYYKLLNGNWNCGGTKMRFPGEEPGSYQRTFTLPKHWTGRRIYLVLDGTDGVCEGAVNGHAFATFQGAAEFEITQFVIPGENTIELTTSENIWGDVYLLARPHAHVWNYQVQTTGDTVEVNVEIRNPKAALILSGELYNWERDKIGQTEGLVQNGKATLHFTLSNPKPWTAEDPYLYTVLLACGGEVVPVNVGLRKPILKERPRTCGGRRLASIESLLISHKQSNANCVYVKPGKMPPRFYRLCDYYGLEAREADEFPTLRAEKTIEVTEVDAKAGLFALTNQFDYTDLAEVDIRWTVSNQSGVQDEGLLTAPCKPDETVRITLPYTLPELSYEEFFLDFDFIAKSSKPWRKAGDVIYSRQFPLPVEQTESESMPADRMPEITVIEKDGVLEICGEEFCYRFAQSTGQLSAIEYNGVEMLAGQSNFGLLFSDETVQEHLQSMRILNIAPTHTEIITSYILETQAGTKLATCAVFWAFFGNGEISVSVSGNTAHTLKPNTVLTFNLPLPQGYGWLKHFGRNAEGRIRIYDTCLSFGAMRLKDNRFLCCTDAEGFGLFVKSLPPYVDCSFSTQRGVEIEMISVGQGTDFCHAFTLRPCFTESLDLIRDARVLPQI